MKIRNKSILIIIVLLVLLSIFWTKNWFGDVLPLSPREENIPELSYIWNLYHAAGKGIIFSSWNPLQIMGNANLTQRGYLLFAPLAYISFLLRLSPDVIYKIAVPVIFFISGLGIYFFLKELKLRSAAALVGGTVYMLAPPHLAIGIEGFDFNVFWAVLPWCMFIFERYINKKNVLFHSTILGILLTIALIVGTAYFALAIPIFGIYILLRLFLAKPKKAIKFLFLSLLIFLTTSAYITLPSIIEAKYSWINQETTRKKIVNLPTFSQLISLYPKRLRNYPVLDFNFHGNFTDMSWYLGITSLSLTIISIFSKKKWKLILPLSMLILVLVPFYLIIKFAFIKSIFIVISNKIPKLQALYDQTYRLFLPVTFSIASLAGFGADYVSKLIKNPRKSFLLLLIILCIVIVDFIPYTAFFRSVPMSTIKKDLEVYEFINNESIVSRYWSPFPFVWHLPKYRREYLTRYLTRNRVNSSFLYIPYSSRYSSEIYDVFLAGALEFEKKKASFIDVMTALNWGDVDYVLLRPDVYDYSNAISKFKDYGFNLSYKSETLLFFTRNNPSQFINIYPDYKKVPQDNANNLTYWFKSYQNGIVLYEGKPALSNQFLTNNPGKILEWNRSNSERIEIQVLANQSLILTASESWYPGWSVTIDNKYENLVRANYAILGVIVPQGRHNVVFCYKQPWYYLAGKFISLLSLILLSLVFVIRKIINNHTF